MAADNADARSAELDAEEIRLREELRAAEDRIHSTLRSDAHGNAEEIATIEKRVRAIVLALTAIERERIELSVAASL
jgi:hypothetical protein